MYKNVICARCFSIKTIKTKGVIWWHCEVWVSVTLAGTDRAIVTCAFTAMTSKSWWRAINTHLWCHTEKWKQNSFSHCAWVHIIQWKTAKNNSWTLLLKGTQLSFAWNIFLSGAIFSYTCTVTYITNVVMYLHIRLFSSPSLIKAYLTNATTCTLKLMVKLLLPRLLPLLLLQFTVRTERGPDSSFSCHY